MADPTEPRDDIDRAWSKPDQLDRAVFAALQRAADGGGEAMTQTLRESFEAWYDAQPDGRIDLWDVWQAAHNRIAETGRAMREAQRSRDFGVMYTRDAREDAFDALIQEKP